VNHSCHYECQTDACTHRHRGEQLERQHMVILPSTGSIVTTAKDPCASANVDGTEYCMATSRDTLCTRIPATSLLERYIANSRNVDDADWLTLA